MSRSSHRPCAVRPRQRGTRHGPHAGSEGQLSLRNEVRRKVRHPEVQHLLLPGGRRGTAGLACSSPSPDPTVLLPLESYQHWLPHQQEPASTLGDAPNNFEKLQDRKPGCTRTTHCLHYSILPLQRLPGPLEPFRGSPSPQTLTC